NPAVADSDAAGATNRAYGTGSAAWARRSSSVWPSEDFCVIQSFEQEQIIAEQSLKIPFSLVSYAATLNIQVHLHCFLFIFPAVSRPSLFADKSKVLAHTRKFGWREIWALALILGLILPRA